jgi:hypothetical protein
MPIQDESGELIRLKQELLEFVIEELAAKIERGELPQLGGRIADAIEKRVSDAVDRKISERQFPDADLFARQLFDALGARMEARRRKIVRKDESAEDEEQDYDDFVDGSRPWFGRRTKGRLRRRTVAILIAAGVALSALAAAVFWGFLPFGGNDAYSSPEFNDVMNNYILDVRQNDAGIADPNQLSTNDQNVASVVDNVSGAPER